MAARERCAGGCAGSSERRRLHKGRRGKREVWFCSPSPLHRFACLCLVRLSYSVNTHAHPHTRTQAPSHAETETEAEKGRGKISRTEGHRSQHRTPTPAYADAPVHALPTIVVIKGHKTTQTQTASISLPKNVVGRNWGRQHVQTQKRKPDNNNKKRANQQWDDERKGKERR